jgi:RND family efflux transporter MFP subunit
MTALGCALLSACVRHGDAAAPLDETTQPPRVVNVARPKPAEAVVMTLPANIDAFQTSLLHARVNGYLLGWQADIGDRVQQGQELAEIDTPELDQELAVAQANLAQARVDLEGAEAELAESEASVKQAEADIAKAKANLEFAQLSHQRNEKLLVQRAISTQDLEESRRDVDARQAERDSADAQLKTRQSNIATRNSHIKSHEAAVTSLEASVRRLEQLQSFKIIQAPFDGIVIRRRVELGELVSAGSASNSHELFALAQADTLRIRISVPQAQARTIQVGQAAEVMVPEYPDRVFTAKVARTARMIDSVTRTLMVELELPNDDYALLPGTYGTVRLTVARAESAFTVPASVLLSRTEGLSVAVVDSQNVVRLRKVKLGRDFGATIEVLAGLKGEEALVINPPDDLADNECVAIATSAEAGGTRGVSTVAQKTH